MRTKRICSISSELQCQLQNLEKWLIVKEYNREKGFYNVNTTLALTFHPALYRVANIEKSPLSIQVLPKQKRVR